MNKAYPDADYKKRELDLSKSPMFNLSMASKELFHSNFLYWISITYRGFFLTIVKDLGIITDKWSNDWKSYREKKHFDLSIYDSDNNLILIIENKVKSTPYKEQMEKYDQIINNSGNYKSFKILLSLTTVIPNQNEIEKSGWKIVNYSNLADAINKSINMIKNEYHKSLVKDYCETIIALHKIQSSWILEDKDSYIEKIVKDEDVDILKIGDLRKKILCSQIAMKLQHEIDAHIKTNNEIKKESNDCSGSIGKCYINWGMTHSMGIVDVKVRIRKNLIIGVQLQGEAYRHYIETLDGNSGDMDFLKSIRSIFSLSKELKVIGNTIINNIFKKGFIQAIPANTNGYSFDKDIVSLPIYRNGKKENSKGYNKYGSTFIYQYIKLSDKVTIGQIINAIKNDIETINQILFEKR